MTLKQQLTDDMKAAMKAGEKDRLGVIRLINAAIKQKEVDERVDLDDAAVLAVLEKMVKQRKDSVSQYEGAGREDLAAVERAEIVVIEAYLPAKLGEAEIAAAIDAAIAATGASGPADMGKLMGVLKPQLAGQAEPVQVGALTIADFVNPAGLQAKGENLFVETGASGPAQSGAPGENGTGLLVQGSLEGSNVNVVEELVSMIETQRAYETNAKAISTIDSMLAYLNNKL